MAGAAGSAGAAGAAFGAVQQGREVLHVTGAVAHVDVGVDGHRKVDGAVASRRLGVTGRTPALVKAEGTACSDKRRSHGRGCRIVVHEHLPLLSPQDGEEVGQRSHGHTTRLTAGENGCDHVRRQVRQLHGPPDVRPVDALLLREFIQRGHFAGIQHPLPAVRSGQGYDQGRTSANVGVN